MRNKQRDIGANHCAHSHWDIPAEEEAALYQKTTAMVNVRFSDGGRIPRSQFPLMPKEGLG